MGILSTTQPSLRVRMLPRFPAQVVAGNGIIITKSGATYIFQTTAYANIPLSAIADIPTDSLVGRDTVGDGSPEVLSVSGGLAFSGAGGLQVSDNNRLRTERITLTGSPITTGIKGDMIIPYAAVLKAVTLLGDQSGSIVVNVWKDTLANYPPTVADKITGSAPATISAALSARDDVLSGWTTAIAAGDILRFNVDSVATFTRIVVCLDLQAV